MNHKGNRWKRGIGIRCKKKKGPKPMSIRQVVARALQEERPTSYGQMTARLDRPDWGIGARIEANREVLDQKHSPLPRVVYDVCWREAAPTQEELKQQAAVERDEEARRAAVDGLVSAAAGACL